MLVLKALRIKNNFTQQQLADLLKVKKTTVSEWERGNSIPRYNTLLKLKEIFKVQTVDYLLEQEANPIIKE